MTQPSNTSSIPEFFPGVVILGAGGQLGTALQELAAERADGAEGVARGHVVALGRAGLDLEGSAQQLEAGLNAAIAQAGPGPVVVINAAAWTAVDAAEDSENAEAVEKVNAFAPGVLAQVAKEAGAGFIHVSTDYVFGPAGPRTADFSEARGMGTGDKPAPVNEYGRSKLAGERQVLGAGGYVVRTAWVFSGPSGPGRDFVDTMQDLANRGINPTVVADQWGRPTYTKHLAAGLIELAGRLTAAIATGETAWSSAGIPRLLHATGGGEPTTWAGFAAQVFHDTGHDPARVRPIPTEQYPTPARRPTGMYLDTSSWERAGLEPLPAWQDGLRAALG